MWPCFLQGIFTYVSYFISVRLTFFNFLFMYIYRYVFILFSVFRGVLVVFPAVIGNASQQLFLAWAISVKHVNLIDFAITPHLFPSA